MYCLVGGQTLALLGAPLGGGPELRMPVSPPAPAGEETASPVRFGARGAQGEAGQTVGTSTPAASASPATGELMAESLTLTPGQNS